MKAVTYRSSPRKKVPKIPFGKPRYRKLPREQVCDLVKALILKKKAALLRKLPPGIRTLCLVTAEDIASELDVEIHKVTWSLQQLNHQGLVGQRENFCDRGYSPILCDHRRCFSDDEESGWRASNYRVIIKDSEYNGHDIPSRPDDGIPEGTIWIWDDKPTLKPGRFSKRLGHRIGEKHDSDIDGNGGKLASDRNCNGGHSKGVLLSKGRV